MTIPQGILQPSRSYKWRVEVFDDSNGWIADNRSSSAWCSFTTTADAQPGGEIRGDFDLDGVPDILWRIPATGSNALWYMNAGGNSIKAAGGVPSCGTSGEIGG